MTMITRPIFLAMSIVSLLASGDFPSWAAEPQQGPVVGSAPAVLYVPPKVGAPRGRVGGGARGAEGDLPKLTVLAPDHPGLTTEAHPVLYWYVSRATSAPVEFTLMSDDQINPVLETKLVETAQPGVHKINLADHGIKLEVGPTYRWYVSVVRDKTRRSRDLLAGGVIQRIELPADLPEKLAAAKTEDRPMVLASAGIWYDTIAALSSSIEKSPSDEALREQRAKLLEQVGLLEVAGFDRKDSK